MGGFVLFFVFFENFFSRSPLKLDNGNIVLVLITGKPFKIFS